MGCFSGPSFCLELKTGNRAMRQWTPIYIMCKKGYTQNVLFVCRVRRGKTRSLWMMLNPYIFFWLVSMQNVCSGVFSCFLSHWFVRYSVCKGPDSVSCIFTFLKGPILYCFSSISDSCKRSNTTVFDMNCPKPIHDPEFQLSKSRSSELYWEQAVSVPAPLNP